MKKFKLETPFSPCGDQPGAISQLTKGIENNIKEQTLLGVTGSGKTFTMANIIAKTNRPTLILAHNKTLAAQLFSEFKSFFPDNAVEYFVSYYDYYQPEAYIPQTDTFIEKDTSINEYIDKMRHSATRSLLERNDVIIIASVSCIYGLGSPESYQKLLIPLKKGEKMFRDHFLLRLIERQYARNDIDFSRGNFRVRGDYVEVFPIYEDKKALKVVFDEDDFIEGLFEIDPLTGKTVKSLDETAIYPGSHFVTPKEQLDAVIAEIEAELKEYTEQLSKENKLLEMQRIQQRTNFDLEMIRQTGFCSGIENYSRHLCLRKKGETPQTLLTYFPDNFLLFVDESHMTLPQVRGMFAGDHARKTNLVNYGFRLPSALDNRPLNFNEFQEKINQVIYVSATPGPYELEHCGQKHTAEQIIRPTGLPEPEIIKRPVTNQVDDLMEEIRLRIKKKERVLVTTLTKKMAENLTDYYSETGIKVKYLHSDVETLKRNQIIADLRLGKFDVLVGINLLREGLDIPEVSLVAVLDADKEGFLRSQTSLTQICGRAARNINGKVILYCDKETDSIKNTIKVINRRREIQLKYNEKNNITPKSITKKQHSTIQEMCDADYITVDTTKSSDEKKPHKNVKAYITKLKRDMKKAADKLQFEKAAEIRDELNTLLEDDLFKF